MRVLAGLKILACLFVFSLALAPADAQTPAQASEAKALAGEHPAAWYKRAAALFQSGKKDDATFVFYLGQLRYRAHLSARSRELRPDGDPALFASLSETIGRPINEHAFGDLPALGRVVDGVLAFDRANPDRFTPPSQYPRAWSGVRNGLAQMKAQLLSQADKIRAQRRRNGLENRT